MITSKPEQIDQPITFAANGGQSEPTEPQGGGGDEDDDDSDS